MRSVPRAIVARLLAVLGVLLLTGLAGCPQSAVLLDTCDLPEGADRLQVTFEDSAGATGATRFDRVSGDGPAGTAAVTLDGNVAYPVRVQVQAFQGNQLIAEGTAMLADGESEVQACVQPVGPGDDGGPDGPDQPQPPTDLTGDVPIVVDRGGDRPDLPPPPDRRDLGMDMTPDVPIVVDMPPDLPPPVDVVTPDVPPADMCLAVGDVCTVDTDCCSQNCRNMAGTKRCTM
jgi:hypothetical protein